MTMTIKLHSRGNPDFQQYAPISPKVEIEVSSLRDASRERAEEMAQEIAASGRHTLLLGPPGCGKTMVARRVAKHLGPLSAHEQETLGWIYYGAGMAYRIPTERPFRAPHHTASTAACIGTVVPRRDGTKSARPGEVSLAHAGVLLLDELPEFRTDTVERIAYVVRKHGYSPLLLASCTDPVPVPAEALVIGAANPCPCGWKGVPRRVCRCPADWIQRWERRIEHLIKIFDFEVREVQL